jgi:hypothetical protein
MIISGTKLFNVGFVNDVQPIVSTNLVANYDAAVGISGSTLVDSSSNGYNATLFNSPTIATYNNTKVLQLSSASSQYFGYTSGYGTTLNSAFTFDVWCYPFTSATAGTLIGEWNNSTFNSGWTDDQMGFTTTSINCGVYNTGYAVAKNSWTNNTWYNIVMVYNGSGLTTYVNNVAGGTTTGAKANPGAPGTYLSMGLPATDYLSGVSGYFNGYIGAWKIYSVALNTTQLTQNFTALRGRYGV